MPKKYEELSQKYPKSDFVKMKWFQVLDVETLEKHLDEYVLQRMRKGTPLHVSASVWDQDEKKVFLLRLLILESFAFDNC